MRFAHCKIRQKRENRLKEAVVRLFVSALEYSANIHLKYLLREMIKSKNIELCGIFDESVMGNSSLELHSAGFGIFGTSQTPSLVSAPKIPKNYESQIENPSVVDSTQGVESNEKTSESNLNHNAFFISGKSLCDIESVGVMGFIDVLKRAKFFLQLRKKCVNLALSADKILLMDSSSFNIPLAKRVKKRDSRKEIMYYILPQVWAWKPWRARVIEANCDKLAAILPFEVKCYEKKAKFVGHPLLDEIQQFRVCNSPLELHSVDSANFECSQTPSLVSHSKFAENYESQTENPSVVDSLHESNKNQSARSANPRESFCYFWLLPKIESPLPLNPNLPNNANYARISKLPQDEFAKIFTFMPGSRLSEINRIFPIFLQVKDMLKKRDSKAQFHLVVPKKFSDKNLSEIYGDLNDFHITFDAHTSLLQSTFAFICSGTATLECALIGTPFVLGYQGRWIEAFVVKQFLNIRFVGLANLLYSHIAPDSQFHIELLQENLTAQNLLDSYHNANPNDFLRKSLALRAYLKSGSARAVAQWLLEK